jgi:hypothetical protein
VTGSSAASLTAEINWGDNTHSAAVVRALGGGTFSITGTHTYAESGNYTLTVTTVDPDPLNSRMVNAVACPGSGNDHPESHLLPAQHEPSGPSSALCTSTVKTRS